MNKYLVIAVKWDNEVRAQVKYVAGEFSEYMCAVLFRDAYNENYVADAYIVESKELINR